MSTPRWVHYKNDRCYGHNDPDGHADTYNRASKDVWSNFCRHYDSGNGGLGEHDKDGDHCEDLTTNVWACETYYYTGNNTDERTVTLINTNIEIQVIRIWNNTVAYTFYRTADMTGDATMKTDGSALADGVQSIATKGQFEVGLTLDASGVVYYYQVYGPVVTGGGPA